MPRHLRAPRPSAPRENRYGWPVSAPRLPWTQVSRACICLGVAVGIAAPVGLAPRVASAATAGPEASNEVALDESKKLYDEGLAHFETHDYEGAVDKWTLAYSKLPADAEGQRNAMVYNIATAQEKAYEVDKDVQHLRQAQLLLESYVKNYKAMYQKTPETKAEVDKANARIQALRDRIAAAEAGAAPSAPVQPVNPSGGQLGTHDGIQWSSGHTPPVDQEKLAHNRRLSSEASKADTLIIAGWATGSVGLFLLLVGTGAVVGGSRTDTNGATYGGVAALVLGAGGVAAGGALLGVGFKKRNAARNGQIAVSPMVAPGFAGAGVSGRF
jgi:hypothetical protein